MAHLVRSRSHVARIDPAISAERRETDHMGWFGVTRRGRAILAGAGRRRADGAAARVNRCSMVA
jgi:hypothetical protein